MSLRLLAYVHTNPPRDLAEYRVLGELATLSDPAGVCTVGQVFLAQRCELSRSTVRVVLDRLERDGRIARVGRRGLAGRGVRTSYTICTEPPPEQLAFDLGGCA